MVVCSKGDCFWKERFCSITDIEIGCIAAVTVLNCAVA
jgi:hypothetical protein